MPNTADYAASVEGYSLRWLRQVPAARNYQCVGIGWVIEMQCGGGHFIPQHKSLFFIAYAYRNRTAGVIAVCFGGNHQVKFIRQRMLVLDFLLIAQLRVGPAAPRLWTGNPAGLVSPLQAHGDVEDVELVGFVANIVINNFQRINMPL